MTDVSPMLVMFIDVLENAGNPANCGIGTLEATTTQGETVKPYLYPKIPAQNAPTTLLSCPTTWCLNHKIKDAHVFVFLTNQRVRSAIREKKTTTPENRFIPSEMTGNVTQSYWNQSHMTLLSTCSGPGFCLSAAKQIYAQVQNLPCLPSVCLPCRILCRVIPWKKDVMKWAVRFFGGGCFLHGLDSMSVCSELYHATRIRNI